MPYGRSDGAPASSVGEKKYRLELESLVILARVTEGLSTWFAGPKAENGEWFESVLGRIIQDYYAWRRNYFPEDGVVLGSEARREGEPFRDRFEDRLLELLARLKADFPFQSPRYAAHMVAEQTLPSIAGYFAAMLYNPNNVSREAAPVTVRLELEACQMIGRMIGYGEDSWGHLTSGGTVANLEALWTARTVAYLPEAIAEMRAALGLEPRPLPGNPMETLAAFNRVFHDAERHSTADVIRSYLAVANCVVERGMHKVVSLDGRRPVILVPESHHYCFEKSLDILGMGRDSLIGVPVDNNFRMDVEELDVQLDRCRRGGDRVIAVVAVVGSTEEGAVDPVDQILDLRSAREEAGRNSFWLHVDGAYGGYLRTMTQPERIGLGEPWVESQIRGRSVRLPLDLPVHGACDALERMGEADSVTIDPHKLGYIPYPAGAICYRSDLVKPILRQEAPYIAEGASNPDTERREQGVGMYILEDSKPGAAAASVWLSHTLIPLDSSGLGGLIRGTVRNACELHALLNSYPGYSPAARVRAVTLCAPGSNIVCYAFRPNKRAPLAEINELNRHIYEQFTVNEKAGRRVYDQKFFVSRTTLTSKQYGMAAVGPFLTRLGVSQEEYREQGIFLLRSVLMNPWYDHAKEKGRNFLAELTEELYAVASDFLREST